MNEQKIPIIHLQMVKDSEIVYGEIKMEHPKKAAELVKKFLGNVDRECVVVCATDTKMKPVYLQLVAMGAINYCPVSVPELFKAALLSNAANILLFHNHPSGDVTPSSEDIQLTKRVVDAGKLLGIPLLDHIILGEDDNFYSFRESGRFLEGESIN